MRLTKTEPFKHQAEIIEATKDREYAGLFMEQGTGKTFVTIATATHLFRQGKLDAVIVLAPNGVHLNWARNEIPAHNIVEPHELDVAVWRSTDGVKKRNRFIESVKNVRKGKLTYILANIESLRTKAFLDIIQKDLIHCSIFDDPTPFGARFMLVIDESIVIKNQASEITKAAWRLADHAAYRRILTGTPVSQGPVDLYAQCRFLSRQALPYNSLTVFKHDFVIEQAISMGPGRPSFNKIVGYRNQEKLAKVIRPFTWRVMKDECLDLPPKIYQTRYVELTAEQKRIYKEIVRTSMATIENEAKGIDTVTALTACTAMLRCQQVTLGYVVNDNKITNRIPSNRIASLEAWAADLGDAKAIIFCHYKEDVRQVVEALSREGAEAVAYSGEIKDEERIENVRRFQEDPGVKWFVGTSAAARGLTLTAASYVIYYSQGFSLDTRLQSEDRAHRIGQTKSVVYINLVARGTVDERIIKRLMEKREVAEQILTKSELGELLELEE